MLTISWHKNGNKIISNGIKAIGIKSWAGGKGGKVMKSGRTKCVQTVDRPTDGRSSRQSEGQT